MMSARRTWVHSFAGLSFALLLPLAAFAFEDWRFNPATGHYYRPTENRYFGISDEACTANRPDWFDAQDEAARFGGHLVTIDDAEENDWLVSTFGGEEEFWIGYTDFGTENQQNNRLGWYWISRECPSFENWGSSEPNDGLGQHCGEDSAHLNHICCTNVCGGNPGCWNDLGNGRYTNHDEPLRGIIEAKAICAPSPPYCASRDDASLVSWWRANGDADDFTGRNHGRLSGSVEFSPGRQGSAFRFDSDDDRVIINSSESLKPCCAFTVEFWVKASSMQDGATDGLVLVVDKSHDGNERTGWFFQGTPAQDALNFGVYTEGGDHGAGLNGFFDDRWHHIAATYDAEAPDPDKRLLIFYKDGIEVHRNAAPGRLRHSDRPVNLGFHDGGRGNCCGRYFRGLIDEFSFYDQALSPEQIRAIFQAGSFGKCADSSCAPPEFCADPLDVLACEGTAAWLSAAGAGALPLAYQWQKYDVLKEVWEDVPGATSGQFLLNPVRMDDAGNYRVILSNDCGGPLTSEVAALTIEPTASCDCNDNGTRDECDIISGRSADCDSSGVPDECEPLVVDDMTPLRGLTTARTRGGSPIVVTVTGQGFIPGETTVYIGGVEAQIEEIAQQGCTVRVRLPVRSPGPDCAAGNEIPAPVSVVVGLRSAHAPADFIYEISKIAVRPGDSVQEAIEDALPGTCIVVAEGEYAENLVFDDGVRQITLTAEDPLRLNTQFAAASSGLPTVRFDSTGADTILTGFEIVLGNGGIVILNASPWILGNAIQKNAASGEGGGIRVEGDASAPRIESSIISRNTSGGGGGGVAVLDGTASVVDCSISSNLAGGDGGGVLARSSLTLRNSHIRRNQAEQGGGGVFANVADGLVLEGNVIEFNQASSEGGGLYVAGSGIEPISGNSLGGNVSGSSGGGVYVGGVDAALMLRANEITENSSEGDGAGVCLSDGNTAILILNRLVANRSCGGSGAGVYVPTGTEAEIRANLFAGNGGFGIDSTGGGVFIAPRNSGSLVMENMFRDNAAQRGGALICGESSNLQVSRNVFAFNRVKQNCDQEKPAPCEGNPDLCNEPGCNPEKEECPEAPPFLAPAVLAGDIDARNSSGADIVNNTFHANVREPGEGALETGGSHGIRLGYSVPSWINNIFTENEDWGVFCDETNKLATLDYNDFHANRLGGLHPFCDPDGRFENNVEVDPLYLDSTFETIDFALDPSSPVRGRSDDGGDMGGVLHDAVIGVSDCAVYDVEASPTVLLVPGGAVDGETEVFLRIAHHPANLIPGSADTLFVDILMLPDPGVLANEATLIMPLRYRQLPQTPLQLLHRPRGGAEFVATGIIGRTSTDGLLAVFAEVTDPGTYVAVAAPEAACPVLGDFDENCTVDLADYAALAGCLASPGVPVSPECVGAFDSDADLDVDLLDYAAFSVVFQGN
ncbi:MAG: hypothetical protein FLDDKLPJ_00566 [Phycisphaerae bacterium]|nr:hypothetical protein [Phycisphaerae bacterium]